MLVDLASWQTYFFLRKLVDLRETEVITLIRHYFEAAQAMSPTAVGNGTLA